MIKACIFDAFGTIFNLDHELLKSVDHPSVNDILSYARTKQLSYTWLRSLMEEYESFDEITFHALQDGCDKYTAPRNLVGQLSKLYFEPVIFDDVIPGLSALRRTETTIGILSNGTRKMLECGIQKNRLDNYIDVIYSADQVKIFKPDPKVYNMVCLDLKIRAGEVLFVSSNQWDVAGAAKFGCNVAWLNRNHAFRESITKRPKVTEVHALAEVKNLTDSF